MVVLPAFIDGLAVVAEEDDEEGGDVDHLRRRAGRSGFGAAVRARSPRPKPPAAEEAERAGVVHQDDVAAVTLRPEPVAFRPALPR